MQKGRRPVKNEKEGHHAFVCFIELDNELGSDPHWPGN